MKKTVFIILIGFFINNNVFAQNVGIGTTSPHAKAVLEIKATDKGVLFPRLTTEQRNAITNPPDGLHIFNITEHCLNYYDSLNLIWNCYCSGCQTVIINVGMGDDMCNVDFYSKWGRMLPALKYIINIPEDTYFNGCNPGDTALSFINMPPGISVIINNYGFILGGGGKGGNGQIEPGTSSPCNVLFTLAQAGQPGGAAIATKAAVQITVNNYGVVAGGGGGGGGSSKGATTGYGGGGGAGAGLATATGGMGGGFTATNCTQFGCVCVPTVFAQPGGVGTSITPGNGGAGFNGGPAGGNGGNRGQAGQNGNIISGGAAGKAIGGGSANSINNFTGGQSFGTID